jgi:hypothetical protein
LPENPELWQAHNNHGTHFGYSCRIPCYCDGHDVRGVRETYKHGFTTLLLCLERAHCFASSVVTPRGYKNEWSPSCTPMSSGTSNCCLLASFLAPEKREREMGREKAGDFWGLESVASPSISSHGGTRLDLFHSHAGTLVEPHEPGVHDGGGARNLSCAQGSRIPHAGGGIRGGFHGHLRAEIRCAIAPIPLLTTTTL